MMKPQLIKVGLLADVQGDFGVVGGLLLRGSQLAVEEINAAGGIDGREIELIHLDPNMDIARYQECTRRFLEQDKVDLVMGSYLSVHRETVRAIVNRTDTLFMYTNIYEGGVCDASMIGIGMVPEQQLAPLVPWMVKTYGKKVYAIGIENNYGRYSVHRARKLLEDQGGQVLGEEFFAVGAAPQFDQTIQNIKRTKPDWILTLIAGASQDAFFEQAKAADVTLPLGSPNKVSLMCDHKRLAPPALDKMHVVTSWVEEMDTPAANNFKKLWRRKFPNELYISCMGHNSYAALHMYKTLVEKAGSTKKADLRAVIAKGEACIEAPGGKLRIDPKSQHTTQHMRLFSVDAAHSVREVEDFGMVEPYWLASLGCDLTKEDPKTQYTPVR